MVGDGENHFDFNKRNEIENFDTSKIVKWIKRFTIFPFKGIEPNSGQ